eukprot:Rmarinus@m.18743
MARKRKRDALQPSVDLPLRDNNTKDVADMRVTRAKSRRLQPKTAITDLPVDVLTSIFSLLPNEHVLLGAVAKVNREFRDIATDDQVRGAVQERFVREHATKCNQCWKYVKAIEKWKENSDYRDLRYDFVAAASSNSLGCFMFYLLATNRNILTSSDYVPNRLMDTIVYKGRLRILRYLAEECNINDIKAVSLKDCAFRSADSLAPTYDIIRYIVEELGLGSDWDARVELFHNAIGRRHLGAVRYLVEEGSDGKKLMYARADDGATALHTAAANDILEMVQYFVEDQGAEDMAFMKNHAGDTPLLLAVSKGRRDIVLYFLEKFKSSNLLSITGKWGKTVLHRCLNSYETPLFRSLAEAGPANLLTFKNDFGQTVLHTAASDGSLDIVRYILGERGATDLLTEADFSGETPLMAAVTSDKMDVVRYLIAEGGASSLTHDVDSSGNTLLHTCARRTPAMMRCLWEHEGMADLLRVRNYDGQTVLHVAASRNAVGAVRFLVEKCGAGDMVHD